MGHGQDEEPFWGSIFDFPPKSYLLGRLEGRNSWKAYESSSRSTWVPNFRKKTLFELQLKFERVEFFCRAGKEGRGDFSVFPMLYSRPMGTSSDFGPSKRTQSRTQSRFFGGRVRIIPDLVLCGSSTKGRNKLAGTRKSETKAWSDFNFALFEQTVSESQSLEGTQRASQTRSKAFSLGSSYSDHGRGTNSVQSFAQI